MCTAETGRTQDCTPPPRQTIKSTLAMREPSTQDIPSRQLSAFGFRWRVVRIGAAPWCPRPPRTQKYSSFRAQKPENLARGSIHPAETVGHFWHHLTHIASKVPVWLNSFKSEAVGAGVSEETERQDIGADSVGAHRDSRIRLSGDCQRLTRRGVIGMASAFAAGSFALGRASARAATSHLETLREWLRADGNARASGVQACLERRGGNHILFT
jgi:hypothetical protein